VWREGEKSQQRTAVLGIGSALISHLGSTFGVGRGHGTMTVIIRIAIAL